MYWRYIILSFGHIPRGFYHTGTQGFIRTGSLFPPLVSPRTPGLWKTDIFFTIRSGGTANSNSNARMSTKSRAFISTTANRWPMHASVNVNAVIRLANMRWEYSGNVREPLKKASVFPQTPGISAIAAGGDAHRSGLNSRASSPQYFLSLLMGRIGIETA